MGYGSVRLKYSVSIIHKYLNRELENKKKWGEKAKSFNWILKLKKFIGTILQ